jgi:Ca2+-dependent lipid-binding protein
LVVTSFVIGIGTESELIFLGMFALFIIGILVSLEPLMRAGESFFTVSISWVIGLIVSFLLAYMGYSWGYLFIIIVVTGLIYLISLIKILKHSST